MAIFHVSKTIEVFVSETLRSYFKQLREETSVRMLDRLYNEDGTLNKWWKAFAKRKFMGITVR